MRTDVDVTSIEAELERYRYQSDERMNFHVHRSSGIPYALSLQGYVPDTHRPGEMVLLGSTVMLNPALLTRVGLRKGVQAAVRELLQLRALHEVDEFLRYDGAQLNDPHAHGYRPPVVHNP